MDLNPILTEDLIDQSLIDSNILDRSTQKLEYKQNDFFIQPHYNDLRLNTLIRNIREYKLGSLIENLRSSIESGNLYETNFFICKLKEIRFSKNITKTEAESLLLILDKYVKNNYKDLNFLNDVFSLMIDLTSMKEVRVEIDWKIYLKIFLQVYVISEYEYSVNYSEKFCKNDLLLCDFLKKTTKHFYYTREDYNFIKEEVTKRLVDTDGQITVALLISQIFLPTKYFNEDKELQLKFLSILENRPTMANYILLNFSKVISTPESILICKEQFIDKIFALAFCNWTEGLNLTFFNWPQTVFNDRKISVTLCFIIASFIVHPLYQQYKSKIDRNLKILVNIISSDLTENNSSDSAFFFIKILLKNIKTLSSKINEYEVTEYDSFCEYQILPQYSARIEEINKIFLPIVSKCLLYNEPATFSVVIEYFAMSDIKHVFTEFEEINNYLYENSSNDSNFFFKKITLFIRSLIENICDKKIHQFLYKVIDLAVEKISCVSGDLNNTIIEFFNILLTITLGKTKFQENSNIDFEGSNKNFRKLIEKLDKTLLLICKKMLPLCSVFANSEDELSYSLFFRLLITFISKETAEEIIHIVINYIRDEDIKDKNDFTFLFYFVNSFSTRKDCKKNLSIELWNYIYISLIEGEKSKDISKEKYFYLKGLISNFENYQHIQKDQFLSILKILLEERKDKKRKLAFVMLKYFVYNITLPYVDNGMIYYPDLESLKFIINVWEDIVLPYEKQIRSIIDSNSFDLKDFEEIMNIYLRTAISFGLKFNNIFLREQDIQAIDKDEEFYRNDGHPNFNNSTFYTSPESSQFNYYPNENNKFEERSEVYKIYSQIKFIKNSVINNAIEFFQFSKKRKILGKNEKYFRRTFFAQCLEYDRYYQIRLISSLRKFLVYYRELNFNEISFINTILATIAFYSHVKLLKITEEQSQLATVTKAFKCYIRAEDEKIINNPLFKTVLILENIKPDSSEAYDFFNKLVILCERKINKIPITIDNSVTDLKKFERIFDVFHSLIAVYLAKISDISLLLRTLNRFRLQIDKLKFNTSSFLDSLMSLTKLVNYFIPKSHNLFDKLTKRILPKYLLAIEDDINSNSPSEDNKRRFREYISFVLEKEERVFDSCNYLDSLNLMVDFLTTIKLTINICSAEDKVILHRVEYFYFQKLFEETDLIKKRIFLYGLGIINNLRYRCSKEYSPTQSELLLDENMTKNFSCSAIYDKIYKQEVVEIYESFFQTEEGVKNLFNLLQQLQEFKDTMNETKQTGSSGIFEVISARLSYIFNPHYSDATLPYQRNTLISSLSNSPSLFNVSMSKIIFFFFFYSNFENEEVLFSVFENNKKQSDEKVVQINVLMMMLWALFKKNKINQNFAKCKKILHDSFLYYTYGHNRRIDSEIINLFASVFRILSPKEVRIIFYDEQGLFTYLEKDDVFAMRLVNLICQRFGYRKRMKYIFNQASKKQMENIISKTMSDLILWMKNSYDFEYFYSNYLYISGYITVDEENYTLMYSEKFGNLVKEILEFFRKNQTKESLKLLNAVFREGLYYLLEQPDLFVEVVSEFTCYKRLDPQNYKRKMDSNILMLQKAKKFIDIDFYKICSFLAKKIDTYYFPESFKFCSDVLKKLLIPRLSKLIVGNEIESFQKLSEVVSVAKNGDLRNYFCHHVLSIAIHSLEDTITLDILSNLLHEVEIKKQENDSKSIVSLVTIFTSFLLDYEVILHKYVETVIVDLKWMNKNLFKNIGLSSQIIKKSISSFYNKYSYTFDFVKKQVSEECALAIIELSKSHSYFI